MKPTSKIDIMGGEWKSTAKATISPTREDIVWAAAFLEGEGTFRKTTTEQVRAGQKDLWSLNKLLVLFGGSVRPKKSRDPIQAAQSTWSASGARARGIMMTIYPFMSPRRQAQIRRALEKD